MHCLNLSNAIFVTEMRMELVGLMVYMYLPAVTEFRFKSVIKYRDIKRGSYAFYSTQIPSQFSDLMPFNQFSPVSCWIHWIPADPLPRLKQEGLAH